MVPHPPVILKEVGRGREQEIRETINAYKKAAQRIRSWDPETIIVISPHAVMYRDYFHISPGRETKGDFSQFGAPQVRFHVTYDTELVQEICAIADQNNFPAGTLGERDRRLDHGTIVPLYFIDQYVPEYKLVRIGLSGLSLETCREFGRIIRQAIDKLGKNAVIVASGDLSHRLKPDGPYGFTPEGPVYDERIMDVMGRGAFDELLDFSPELCENAGECGHRSFTILGGILEGLPVIPERLSHQDTFGVGYGICTYSIEATEKGTDGESVSHTASDPWVGLAQKTIETYIRTREKISVPQGLPEEMYTTQAGAFVSLKENGMLRGCIGTISPICSCVAEEIIQNAISAATRDPRFYPVKASELSRLVYSVDVLGPTERIQSPDQLDVKQYGVVVSTGRRRGLLLPNLEGVDTIEEQISIAREKAGIRPEETDVVLERFQVVRHQ